MAEITGGELLARCLAAEDVRFVFGLPCPEAEPFLAALEGNGIRFVPVRHEAAGAHIAEGLYKSTGAVAALLGNPGPGTANLVPGVVTARHEGVPLVAITTQHRLGIVYPSPPSTFQGQDQLGLFEAAAKWGAPILVWDRIPEVVRMAFREVWNGRPGPVQLEIPAPVIHGTSDESTVRVLPPERYRALAVEAAADRIERVADLLADADRPAVVAGSGVDRAGANDALLRLVERLGAPVIPTMAGRAVVPREHPHYVYGMGVGGDRVKREADVVLVAGSRLGNLDLPYDKYWGDPERQKIVQIDVDPRSLGVTRPLAMGILSDARFALEALDAALAKRGVQRPPSALLEQAREEDRAWREAQLAGVRAWHGEGIHPAHAVEAIGRVFGSDPIYVVDGGNTSLWAHWGLPSTRPRSYHSILELGMLGTGVPSALGSKLGAPDREVVCVTGDGAAGFNFMEMQSAAREGAKIVTVVFAEGAWTMEEPSQLMTYGRTFGTQMGEVRWDIVAQGLGCDGFYAEAPEQVAPALEQARASERPAVVCLRTNHDANLAVPQEPLVRFIEVYQGPLG